MVTEAKQQLEQQDEFDVVIVGAGVAGTSAAYHLQKAGVTNILLVDAAPRAGEGISPRHSGSATMPDTVAPCVKMMVQVYACNSEVFMRHHGPEGAKRYLRATEQGLVLQKRIASEIWKNDKEKELHLRALGSYYVAYQEDEGELRKEYETLKLLGCRDIEWWDKDRLGSVAGMSPRFHCAIFFPQDAIIDSSLYAKMLVQQTMSSSDNKMQFWPNALVKQVMDGEQAAFVEFDSGLSVRCKHIVMATGGLFQIPQLNGILKACYSYLVHVPVSNGDYDCEHSANFFTWGFSHDWCFTRGRIRCSGEDHFSAYKPPLADERCKNLSKWTLNQYRCFNHTDNESTLKMFPRQYGVYSETPDMAPIVGQVTKESRICYLVGCNAWGQSILSYCSSLIPGLLKYKNLTGPEKDCLRLFTIRRFSYTPGAGSTPGFKT